MLRLVCVSERMLRFVALAAVGVAHAVELTPANWDAETAGKAVFIKFFAPWCGHCKKLKPDWDKLMKEFKDSDKVLVADVDCTAGGEPLCGSHGVQGYPTLKFGAPDALEDYKGGRTMSDLKEFVNNLKPSCSPFAIDLCDEEEKEKISSLEGLGATKLDEQIAEQEKEITTAEETFKSELDKLQKRYESLSKEKEDTIKKVKDSGLGLMKSVKAKLAKEGKGSSKDEL